MSEILVDKSRSGKDRPWAHRKKVSVLTSEIFEGNGKEKKAERMRKCGEKLRFTIHEHVMTKERKRKLDHAWFCRERMCVMCSWRKSLLSAFNLQKITSEISLRHPNYSYLSLTLTIPNVSGDELKKTITHLQKSFSKMLERKVAKKGIKGFHSNIEITRNLDEKSPNYGTYHPHIHCLLVVGGKYFKTKYISRKDWLEMWKKATGNETITQLDIRRIKSNVTPEMALTIEKDGKKAEYMSKAIFEFSKYITDFKWTGNIDGILKSETFTLDQEKQMLWIADTVMTLDKAIFRKRLSRSGGIIKEIQRELKIKDSEDASEKDLILADNEKEIEPEWNEIGQEVYSWNIEKINYFRKSKY